MRSGNHQRLLVSAGSVEGVTGCLLVFQDLCVPIRETNYTLSLGALSSMQLMGPTQCGFRRDNNPALTDGDLIRRQMPITEDHLVLSPHLR